jgi:hypothetical protein
VSSDFDFEFDPPAEPRRYRPLPAAYPPTNSLGITSLILGLVCLPLMCVPILNMVAVAIGCVGFLLGLAGLISSMQRGGFGIGYAIGGLAANALSVAVALLLIFALATAADTLGTPTLPPAGTTTKTP